MRLEQNDLAAIIQSFKECFQKGDRFYLCGSRIYPEKRGG